MTTTYCKRLIEVDLPIKRISAHSRREKSIRHGHISTLHIWWARRPLAACRAVICASLWPDPADPLCPPAFLAHATALLRARQGRIGGKVWKWHDPKELREALLDFIAEFASWDNSNDKGYLDAARSLTQVAHEALGGATGTRPLVVDPFAGGGAIPLEALRVGADAIASDLNPVASFQQRVLLELAPKADLAAVERFRSIGKQVELRAVANLKNSWTVRDSAGKGPPFSLFVARTVRCPGPACGLEVPLLRGMCLSLSKRAFLAWERNADGTITVDSSRQIRRPEMVVKIAAKQPDRATASGGGVTCPCCNYSMKQSDVALQANTAGFGRRIVAVGRLAAGQKEYWSPTREEEAAISTLSEHELSSVLRDSLALPINPARPSSAARGMSAVTRYGYNDYASLYGMEQLRILDELHRAVAAETLAIVDSTERRLMRALLLLAVDRQATFLNDFCRWAPKGEHPVPPFGKNGCTYSPPRVAKRRSGPSVAHA